MFSTVRYFIKTSIIFLGIGILTGLYMSYTRNILGIGYSTSLVSAHTHVILVGAVMMMIMGVALWFFPKAQKDDRKYNPDMIRAIYYLMTSATLLRFVGEVLTGVFPELNMQIVVTVFSFLQAAAILLFFFAIWGRIRPLGSHIREANGEKF